MKIINEQFCIFSLLQSECLLFLEWCAMYQEQSGQLVKFNIIQINSDDIDISHYFKIELLGSCCTESNFKNLLAYIYQNKLTLENQ